MRAWLRDLAGDQRLELNSFVLGVRVETGHCRAAHIYVKCLL